MKFKFNVPFNTNKIILNYKCKTGTVDDGNSCGNTAPTKFVESPISLEHKTKYESILSDIQKKLPSLLNSVKYEIQQQRKGSKYHPARDEWNKLGNDFHTARNDSWKEHNCRARL